MRREIGRACIAFALSCPLFACIVGAKVPTPREQISWGPPPAPDGGVYRWDGTRYVLEDRSPERAPNPTLRKVP